MLVTASEITDWQNAIGHIILYGMTQHPTILTEAQSSEYVEITITVNGKEIDMTEFVERWQETVNDGVRREAERIVAEKCHTMYEDIHNLHDEWKEKLCMGGTDATT